MTDSFGESSEMEELFIQNVPTASLLGLPLGVRRQIYVYFIPKSGVKYSLKPRTNPRNSANLRFTCRQLYQETNELSWTRGIVGIKTVYRANFNNLPFGIASVPLLLVKRLVYESGPNYPHRCASRI